MNDLLTLGMLASALRVLTLLAILFVVFGCSEEYANQPVCYSGCTINLSSSIGEALHD